MSYLHTHDLRAVQELLGHTDPRMTARYTHIVDMAKKNPVLFIPGESGEGRVGTHLRPSRSQRRKIELAVDGLTALMPMWRTWRAESGAVYFDEGGVASTWATQLWHTEMGRVADRRRTQKPMPEGLLQRADPRLSAKLSSVLLALRRQLRELYGDRLVKLLLYGSQARGDATPWSDVDLLVVLKGRVRPSEEITRTGGIVCGVCLEYDAVIQCLFMDEERFCGSGSPLLRNVFREAIEV